MQHYVLCFMFSPDGDKVVLIKKNKPEWQAGKLNGLGGKVDEGENIHAALVREFLEETGIETSFEEWEQFLEIAGKDYRVYCFRSFSTKFDQAKTMEDEVVAIYDVAKVSEHDCIDNTSWIIPLALDSNPVKTTAYYE